MDAELDNKLAELLGAYAVEERQMVKELLQQEIAKARINEGQMFREVMINHSTPAIYWGKRLDELSLKEHKEK